ncbi:hypothetical protein [Photorhabdus africana]|uniref:hypothetical protein n=1 Tax=Photorhabdus africana TaxID=3097554 RepID=UPI002B409C4C|nr:hypothetical protein [Photorhabdus sp. CRI-LC]
MNQPNNFSPDINTDDSFITQYCKSARYSNYSNNDHYGYTGKWQESGLGRR